MQITVKPKNFSAFSIGLLESQLNFDYFETKKISLIAEVLPKLITAKQVAS